ncbi:hypothetical protein AQUCO_01300621v1 [Aquilegia coerulea]|uniref:GIL1/IRKI C-terminal domain-containing protein n=1 Tax=Aquilegia coerulea TaxID=218851 RepID=A0A2G5E2L6_AQUCA|nr:hypothetical protein AQUCO_01300621v1 [Aquilegia coerulea]
MVMAPSSSTSTSPSPPPPPFQSPLFSPIKENDNEDEQHSSAKVQRGEGLNGRRGGEEVSNYQHKPTPLHHSTTTIISATKKATSISRKKSESDEDDRSVSCNKCRPSSREKNSVIPLDINSGNKSSSSSNASPNGIFKSILFSLTRKSPKSSLDSSRDEQWKIAVSELSHKLIQATRKRDEALLEASRLKHSMSELERKLNKLEIYCHNLKSNLDVCSSSNSSNPTVINHPHKGIGGGGTGGHQDKLIESFCNSVSEARSTVRFLSRSLTVQLRQMGAKVYERISTLLQPYEVKVSFTKNPRSVLFYLEALLNRAFYEDFESVGFQKNGSDLILNPIERCEANYASFNVLQGLTWEEVLNKGTRHFSEEFSRFCDRKMSEIVAMLGWNRAWPEPLLQAFFGAAKSVWLVHLLACSVHPSLPIFRVDKGVKFDGLYMEDMGGDKAQKLVPAMVRIMVAPGFYVYSNVVKCKVLCRYSNTQESSKV